MSAAATRAGGPTSPNLLHRLRASLPCLPPASLRPLPQALPLGYSLTEGLISTGSPAMILRHSTECTRTVGLSATRVVSGARRLDTTSDRLMAGRAAAREQGLAAVRWGCAAGVDQPLPGAGSAAPWVHLPQTRRPSTVTAREARGMGRSRSARVNTKSERKPAGASPPALDAPGQQFCVIRMRGDAGRCV